MTVPMTILATGRATPDTIYLRDHITEMERENLPFTGISLRIQARQDSHKGGSMQSLVKPYNYSSIFRWDITIEEEAVSMAKEHLQYIRANALQLKENFLEINCRLYEKRENVRSDEPPTFNWLDDDWWSKVKMNLSQLAQVASETGLKGILFDTEDYLNAVWTWDDCLNQDLKSRPEENQGRGEEYPDYRLYGKEFYWGQRYEDIAKKVYERGEDFIGVINDKFPRCVVWMLYGWSHVGTDYYHKDEHGRHRPLPHRTFLKRTGNSLLGAFIDGMVASCSSDITLVDGCEGNYTSTPEGNGSSIPGFGSLYNKAYGESARYYTSVPHKYTNVVHVGFPIPISLERNGNDPMLDEAQLKNLMWHAKKIGHGYLWVYSEPLSWWVPPSERFIGPNGEAVEQHETNIRIKDAYRESFRKAVQYVTATK